MASLHPEALRSKRRRKEVSVSYRDPVAELTNLRIELKYTIKERDELLKRERELDYLSSLKLKPISISPKEHVPGSPGFPMTIWSDWHWGEVVRRAETGGVNAFNRKIAKERVERLVNKTIELLQDYGGKTPEYPGIWICLGGDMISGSIHEELRETNWGTVEEQALEVGEVIAGALEKMVEQFGIVFVPCVVGNHGRKAHRPPAKAKVRENREYGVYKSLDRKSVV